MEVPNEIFKLDFDDSIITIEKMDLPGQVIFKIKFSDSRSPLVIARARNFNGEKFWTSIPEGNPELAKQIGALIVKYYLAKK